MSKKDTLVFVLAMIAIACAAYVGHDVGKTAGRKDGFIKGYVTGTYETASRISIHQQAGVVFDPRAIPELILQSLKKNNSLEGFHDDMMLLDSLNFGLFALPGTKEPAVPDFNKGI